MMVNEDYHERLTPEAVDRLLADLKAQGTGHKAQEDGENSEPRAQNAARSTQHAAREDGQP
jgi:hypothetical protein